MNLYSTTDSVEKLRTLLVSLAASPLDTTELNVAGESVIVLCSTDWVKVILIRSFGNETYYQIEAEVSVPSCSDNLEHETLQIQMDVLMDMMTHLIYIRNLLEVSFELSIIREDCLWIASRSFSDIPEDYVFKLLLPPGTKSGSLE